MAEKRVLTDRQLYSLIYSSRETLLSSIFADRADAPWLPFIGLELRVCSFVSARLQEAVLRDSKLVLVFFCSADLTGSSWSSCRLVGCHLRGAILTDAVIEDVVFDRCSMPSVVTKGTVFRRCTFIETQVVPHKTAVLEDCRHIPRGTLC